MQHHTLTFHKRTSLRQSLVCTKERESLHWLISNCPDGNSICLLAAHLKVGYVCILIKCTLQTITIILYLPPFLFSLIRPEFISESFVLNSNFLTSPSISATFLYLLLSYTQSWHIHDSQLFKRTLRCYTGHREHFQEGFPNWYNCPSLMSLKYKTATVAC